MSTPVPSPSLHPTRRQLDELDALMERMLELPVHGSEEDIKQNAAEPSEPSAEPFAELAFPSNISYHTDEVVSAEGEFKFANEPGRPHTTVSLPAGSTAVDYGPPPPMWLWPVVGVNRIYDGLMGGLGRPGRAVGSKLRPLLGWIGLLMLAAALAWGILDWLHWVE